MSKISLSEAASDILDNSEILLTALFPNTTTTTHVITYIIIKIVPSGYMSLMRHGLLVQLKYVEVVSVFTVRGKRCSRGLGVRVVQKKSSIYI